MNKSMNLNSNFQMAFEQMTGEDLAKRIGYTLRDLQTQVRRWNLGSLKKDESIDESTVKSILEEVVKIKRTDSVEKVKKANQLHFLLFGETATDTMPSEAKKPTDEATT